MLKLDRPLLGTVYLVEPHQTEKQRRADLENIAEMGLKLVVLWPPLSRWDSADGVAIAFDSIDRVMDSCAELGLAAILELEGQNPAFQFMPDYLFKAEYFSVDDTGKHWINYLHPEVDRLICGYVAEVAGHFRGHPALFGYDLFNEVNFRSTDRWNLEAFQRWLADKYVTVRELNRVWGRFYTDFSQVRLDNFEYAYSKWSSLLPQLDFITFRADTLATLVKRWADVVRSVDPLHPVLADSSWSMTCFDNYVLGNDDWKVAGAVDYFGLSVYPQSWDVHIASDPCPIAQIYNAGRCASGGRPVFVSELQTHNQTALARNSSVFDELKLWTWQAFMHGIEALVYWKWRPFSRGFQVTGRGLTRQDGTPNDRSRQAAQVAAVVNRNPEVFSGRRIFDSGVGLVYSFPCDTFTDLILPDEKSGFYRDSFAGWYRYLFNRGITPLVLRPEDVGESHASHLKVLILPSLALLSAGEAARLAAFIEGGGSVIADGRFAIIDQEGFAYETAPGGLAALFGYRELDFLSPYPDIEHCAAERFCVIELSGSAETPLTGAGHPQHALTSRTLYLPTFFGHDIENERLKKTIDRFLTPRLDNSCAVLAKSPQVDVTISHGRGVLVSAVNYSRSTRKVRVRVDTISPCRCLTGEIAFTVKRESQSSLLEAQVPAREITGFLFD
ncbi:MAG: alpha-amylase family protein [Candidatus Glassbacteria bacterium]